MVDAIPLYSGSPHDVSAHSVRFARTNRSSSAMAFLAEVDRAALLRCELAGSPAVAGVPHDPRVQRRAYRQSGRPSGRVGR